MDTFNKCKKVGVGFQPVIFEAHSGGWSAGAIQALGFIAQAQRAKGTWVPEGHATRIAQRISMSLMRDAAQAIDIRLVKATRDILPVPEEIPVMSDENDHLVWVEGDEGVFPGVVASSGGA